jgi:hypothetical protein
MDNTLPKFNISYDYYVDKTIYIQPPKLKTKSYGIPPLNNNIRKEDRIHIRFSMDPADPDHMDLKKCFKEIDKNWIEEKDKLMARLAMR